MKKRIISMLVVALMAVMMISTNVLASSGSGTVTVGYNSKMMQAKTDITRTGKYSFASIKATSVYPTGDYVLDTYSTCKTRLYHSDISNRVISDIYTIKEGTTYKVYIYEGYLDLKKFDLCFAGNNPNYNACVSYTYNGN